MTQASCDRSRRQPCGSRVKPGVHRGPVDDGVVGEQLGHFRHERTENESLATVVSTVGILNSRRLGEDLDVVEGISGRAIGRPGTWRLIVDQRDCTVLGGSISSFDTDVSFGDSVFRWGQPSDRACSSKPVFRARRSLLDAACRLRGSFASRCDSKHDLDVASTNTLRPGGRSGAFHSRARAPAVTTTEFGDTIGSEAGIVFAAASTVQEKKRDTPPLRRHEAVGEFVRHDAAFSRTGSKPSISLRRGSRKFGSSKSRPRASTGSSTANPGISVAISNRTPPGSRK